MIRATTIATLLATCASSKYAKASLRGSEDDSSTAPAPLDLNLVVDSIAFHLWHSPKSQFSQYPPCAFVVKGSYPAAIKALENDPNLVLPYNDIDVFLPAVTNKDGDCNQRLYSVQYVQDIIPGQKIEVNFVEMCDFAEDVQDHAEDTDINAASVAFKVVPTTKDGHGEEVPVIDSWATTNSFDKFMSTKTLAITKVGIETRPAHSVIRLMKKAEQLGLDYEIPLEGPGSFRESFHGAQFSKLYKKRLDALGEKHMNAFYDLFDVLPNEQNHRYTLAIKGMEPPAPSQRKLASGCIYDEVDLECFFGVLPSVQLQGGLTYSFEHQQDEFIYIGLLEGEQDTVQGGGDLLAGGEPSFTFVPETPGVYTPFVSGAQSCHDGAATFHVSLKTCLVQ